MQFTTDMAQAILDGKKTVTRRPIKSGEELRNYEKDRTRRLVLGTDSRRKWLEGNTYAICPGRGKPQIARLKLIAIEDQRIQDITDKAAIAEGFENALSFVEKWQELYNGTKYTYENNPWVWVLKFELLPETVKAGK